MVFHLGTLPWIPFVSTPFLTFESCVLILTEASEVLSSLDAVLGFHLSHWCALGSNLVGEPLLGRFTLSRFTPFMALIVVRWSPKAFSRLKNFSDCFSSVLDFVWIMA